MRVTSSMYYKSMYSSNNSQLNSKLFDVNKQIASGLSIQYAKDGVSTFVETMRLDNELASLEQVTKSTESGYKLSNQTDTVLNEFDDTMKRMRTLLLQAANDTNSEQSLDALASELRGIENHFKNLGNSSINGQYIFSGSATNVKPIAPDGTYRGNDLPISSFTGSGTQQQYNITGSELFLGEEILVKRQITTNVVNNNLSKTYPDFTNPTQLGQTTMLTVDDTVRDMMGDIDNNIDTVNAKNHFYINGVRSDGLSFNEHITMRDDESIDSLLNKIGDLYGNTPNLDIVNVSLNSFGQIVVEDKIKGSSKLDFHMVGAVDFDSANGGDSADISDAAIYGTPGLISNLDGGETNFGEILNPTPPAVANLLHVKEFVKSDFTAASGVASNIDALLYDRTQFVQEGSTLSSSIAQIKKDGNAFASESTKISEVADLSQGTDSTLDGTQFTLSGTNIYGVAFDARIDYKNTANGGSTFTLDGGVTNYSIFDMGTPRSAVNADDMTYRQLMDVMNMVVTGQIPASTNTDTDYDKAIYSSNFNGGTYLSNDGKIQFKEINSSETKASISIYDSNSGDFSKDAPVMSFNSNNALTVRDPKTDFFKTIDEIITSVENYRTYPDSEYGDPRNVGIENAISMIDDLQDHFSRSHATVGAQSNSLTRALEQSELLKLSTKTLRSSVVDTDLAEASLILTQLTLNYEAMLSTVGRVSKLSLTNYL